MNIKLSLLTVAIIPMLGNASCFEPYADILTTPHHNPVVSQQTNTPMIPFNYHEQQWALHNVGQTGGFDDVDIDAPEAWQISTGSKEVVVGIISSGIDYNNAELIDNTWVNPNEVPGDGIDNDNNGYIDDVHGINVLDGSGDPMDLLGLGTHAAGTIGAKHDEYGTTGINHDVTMVSCKMFDQYDAGYGNDSISDMIECIDYMMDLKRAGVNIRVINLGWGIVDEFGYFYEKGDELSERIEQAKADDILFVAGSGNEFWGFESSYHIPSELTNDNIISVANTDSKDKMMGQLMCTRNGTVDLGAPGQNIYSTTVGNEYGIYSGADVAASFVTGTAALLLAYEPTLTYHQLKNILMNTGDATYSLNGNTASGKRLNAHAALEGVYANPVASFDFEVEDLAVKFNHSSLGIVNDISQYHWQFGDGEQSNDENPEHTFSQEGIYSVTLTVTDSAGKTDSITHQVEVKSNVFNLSVKRAMKTRTNFMRVELNWHKTDSKMVDVYRDGEFLISIPNHGAHRDFARNVTADSVTYRICESVTQCSQDVVATF